MRVPWSARSDGGTRAACAFCCLASCAALFLPSLAGDVLPAGFRLEQVLKTGSTKPSGIAIAPDGRVFLGERTTGSVRIIKGGVLETPPFTTLSVASAGAGEGLLDVLLHPNFATNHWVYIAYTESGTRNYKVVRFEEINGVGQHQTVILSLGSSPGGTRIGGSIAFGSDGKLYVTTGDFEASSNAQNSSSLSGKMLRLNDDGTVPPDNPTVGSKVYAKGFRNGGGLGVNLNVGTLYQTDQGASGVKEECNAITQGNGATVKNYAWDIGSGKLNNPSYVDPLTEHSTIVSPAAVLSYTQARYPASYRNEVFYACSGNGKIEEVDVTGPKLDTFASTVTFFDPNTDGDGTKDATCPRKWADSSLSRDGHVYLTATDDDGTAASGIYRILYDDTKGPREISPLGSTIPVWMNRTDATHVQITWEDQKRDAFVGLPLATGQHDSKYTVWKGLLPIDSNGNGTPDWNHASLVYTDGTVVNDSTLSTEIVIGGGSSEYYLVSSQNANKEGPLGYARNGAQIPGVGEQDWCNVIGFGRGLNQCPAEFKNRNGDVIQLPDENGVMHSMSEYRNGNAVHFEVGAYNCGFCQQQALEEVHTESKYRARGVTIVMVMEKDLSTQSPPANQIECTNEINTWRSSFGGTYTILCDRDTDGNGRGDVFDQFDACSCFPSNHYIDRNWVIYAYDPGYASGLPDARESAKAWPEWCE